MNCSKKVRLVFWNWTSQIFAEKTRKVAPETVRVVRDAEWFCRTLPEKRFQNICLERIVGYVNRNLGSHLKKRQHLFFSIDLKIYLPKKEAMPLAPWLFHSQVQGTNKASSRTWRVDLIKGRSTLERGEKSGPSKKFVLELNKASKGYAKFAVFGEAEAAIIAYEVQIMRLSGQLELLYDFRRPVFRSRRKGFFTR